MFRSVSPKVNFPELEERILRLWKERNMLHEVDMARKDAPLFTMYEGPPTANGTPGIHHVLARVFKDVIPRFKTMQGYRPVRKGGWDTHGLPVELEVERELNISTKREIEEYGIDRFNAMCRESVMRYVREWEDLTDRIGFWVDMPNAYATFTNDYIETGWWIIKQLWDRGVLYLGTKGAPHCPRCVTTLSSHEVALGYKDDIPDPSVYVKFPIVRQWPDHSFRPAAYDALMDGGVPVSLLAWTTTPWTLPGNTGLAVASEADYAVVEITVENRPEKLIMAAPLVELVVTGDYKTVSYLKGSDLEGLRYELVYDPVEYGTEVRRFTHGKNGEGDIPTLELTDHVNPRVFAADFVSLEDGTGIVHIAPAFGDEDLNVGRKNSLAFVQPVDLLGCITGTYHFAGRFVKEADEDIMRDLQERGLLYRQDIYRHTYPFCWRCDSPLLYYAKSSWYIKTTMVQESLISGNQTINWYPEYIKDGRFGEWLRGNVDWALSRERYWGTPLPVWCCQECGAYECFGSVEELRGRAPSGDRYVLDPERLDLHRPYIDNVEVECKECNGTMRRIQDVTDAWFDSGAMPFAQAHVMSNSDLDELRGNGVFPADYICEAVDQTRGWFYTLHALSTLIAREPCYRNVICLGLILDTNGEKMSKSRGNVVEPWAVINSHGADALRWYLFTAAPPGNARRFSAELVGESVRRFLLTLWNIYSFFVTYANIDGFNPIAIPQVDPVSDLDRWVRSDLELLVVEVTRLMEGYNPTDAGRRIEQFVDVLSNWYVRRSRRRFWKSGNDQDKLSAYSTLYTCLTTIAKLIAPLTPFVAEELYSNLVHSVDPDAPESVHLADFPAPNENLIDQGLSSAMRLAMRVASMGRAARSKAGIRVRQPLAKVLVKTRSIEEMEALNRVALHVIDELNVKELHPLVDENDAVEISLRPNLELLGPKLGPQLPKLRQALDGMDTSNMAQALQDGQPVEIDGFTLSPEEVQISATDRPGYAVARDTGYTVAVVTELTEDLINEGLARELVHRIQNMRRSAGLEISDRITSWYQGNPRIGDVLRQHGDYIQQETLSVELRQEEPETDSYSEEQIIAGIVLKLGVRRAK